MINCLDNAEMARLFNRAGLRREHVLVVYHLDDTPKQGSFAGIMMNGDCVFIDDNHNQAFRAMDELLEFMEVIG